MTRDLERARRLVEGVLFSPSRAPQTPAPTAVTIDQLLFVQLRSELVAAQNSAGSGLSTGEKVETLRAHIARAQWIAAALTSPQSSPSDAPRPHIAIDRDVLQRIRDDLGTAGRLAPPAPA